MRKELLVTMTTNTLLKHVNVTGSVTRSVHIIILSVPIQTS